MPEAEAERAVLRVVEGRIWPREYALFLADGGMCFAYVPGIAEARDTAGRRRRCGEAMRKYGGMAMPSQAFLEGNARNFCVRREEVAGVSYRAGYTLSLWERWRGQGGLGVRMRSGEVRWFWVRTELSAGEVLVIMRRWAEA